MTIAWQKDNRSHPRHRDVRKVKSAMSHRRRKDPRVAGRSPRKTASPVQSADLIEFGKALGGLILASVGYAFLLRVLPGGPLALLLQVALMVGFGMGIAYLSGAMVTRTPLRSSTGAGSIGFLLACGALYLVWLVRVNSSASADGFVWGTAALWRGAGAMTGHQPAGGFPWAGWFVEVAVVVNLTLRRTRRSVQNRAVCDHCWRWIHTKSDPVQTWRFAPNVDFIRREAGTPDAFRQAVRLPPADENAVTWVELALYRCTACRGGYALACDDVALRQEGNTQTRSPMIAPSPVPTGWVDRLLRAPAHSPPVATGNSSSPPPLPVAVASQPHRLQVTQFKHRAGSPVMGP